MHLGVRTDRILDQVGHNWIYFEESLSISKSSPSGKREVVIHEYENEFVGGSDMVKVYYKQERHGGFKKLMLA